MCVHSDCGMVFWASMCGKSTQCVKKEVMTETLVGHHMIKSMNQWNILPTVERRKCPQCEYYQTLYNACYKCNKSYSGPKLEIQHLMIFLLADNYVNRYKMVGDLDTFRDIFWSHSDCIKLLMLSTVLLRDSTYKINTYRLLSFLTHYAFLLNHA